MVNAFTDYRKDIQLLHNQFDGEPNWIQFFVIMSVVFFGSLVTLEIRGSLGFFMLICFMCAISVAIESYRRWHH